MQTKYTPEEKRTRIEAIILNKENKDTHIPALKRVVREYKAQHPGKELGLMEMIENKKWEI